MLSPITVLAEDKKEGKGAEIFISSLQTPPPGYVLEKSFGNFVVVKTVREDPMFITRELHKQGSKASKEIEEIVTKRGGNAVLAETISIQSLGGKDVLIIMQGEAVLLKPAH